MQSALRKALKTHCQIKHGQSSPAVEEALRKAAFLVMRHIPVEEKKKKPAELPDWLSDEALQYVSHGVLQVLDRAGAKPEKPLCVPDEIVSDKAEAPYGRMGLGLFCSLESRFFHGAGQKDEKEECAPA